MSKEERPDKKVYNYRTALEQPIWIQKITNTFSLSNAVKLSTFGWTMAIYFLFLYLVMKLLRGLPIPMPFWVVFIIVPSWALGIIMSDLKIEEQSVGRFLKDYWKMYLTYGQKRRHYYLNDGLFFIKPSVIVKKERRNLGINIKQRDY
ncbi:conjugal transfer protein [Streptococcus suis]|nr:conjugal transfer protein [Streptococcus suis]